MEQIELIRAKPEDAALVHALQLEAFWPLYQLYHDDETSPAKESIERILEKITDPNGEFYIIHLDKRPIGGIRIRHYENGRKLENVNWISPLFIIPGFQNRGIAQQVIRMVMDSYPRTVTWKLDTIKQEKKNCHLYERCGFRQTGDEYRIHEGMSLIEYEKKGCIEEEPKDLRGGNQ